MYSQPFVIKKKRPVTKKTYYYVHKGYNIKSIMQSNHIIVEVMLFDWYSKQD